MVASCAGSDQTDPWSSIVTGVGAGLCYLGLSILAEKFEVDDPLDAFAVHTGGGIWGLFSVCLVGKKGILYALIYPDQISLLNSVAVSYGFH